MAGKIIGAPAATHVCEGRPPAQNHPAATRWECDDCSQVWVVVLGAQYNETYKAWRRLTPRNSNGLDWF